MLLHTFNKASAVHENLRFAGREDHIVLIEDGVYALLSESGLGEYTNVLAIDADISARGLRGRIGPTCKTITYEELVTLCTSADQIANWF